MGTNYYLLKNVCPHCNHAEEKLHIGKSSAGWYFALHVTEDIKSFVEWAKLFAPPNIIIDEYGDKIEPKEMLSIISARRRREEYRPKMSAIELAQNNCTIDYKNNLLRHKVDGQRCIGTGDGTWSYITGGFS